MLQITVEGNEVTVKETIMGWTSDTVWYWYYNLDTRMKSSTGYQGAKLDRPMNEADIEWIKKHYL